MKRTHRFATALAGLSTAAALLIPTTIMTPGTTLAAGGQGERCLVMFHRPVAFELEHDQIKVYAEALLQGKGCNGKTATLFINGHKVAEMTVEDGAVLGGEMIKDEDDAEADGIHLHVLVNGQQTAQVFFEDEWFKVQDNESSHEDQDQDESGPEVTAETPSDTPRPTQVDALPSTGDNTLASTMTALGALGTLLSLVGLAGRRLSRIA
ncbi:MAG: hypothetical protein HY689_10780 [Chloroflexi bacterium]|nr:hypothetical protein [Chloroflexota bacterium]